MTTKSLFLLSICVLLTAFLMHPAAAEIIVEPFGVAVQVEEEAEEVTFNIINDGNEAISFEIDLDRVDREERRRGPRRDEVDLSDMMFAVFQDAQAWNFLDQWMMDNIEGMERLDPDEQGEGYHTYRNGAAWGEVDFEDYDAIVVAGHRQSGNFINQYRDNYERFCDYIAHGGAAYFEMGDPNQEIHSPGDIVNDGQGTEANGRMVVSPDPEDENYSLFADICHESQGGNLWTEGHVIQGSQWTHSHYTLNQFEDNDEIDWFEVIAVKQNGGTPGAISYTFGRGCVLTQGGPTGYNWRNHQQPGRWGSIGAEILYYLTEMTGPGWLLLDMEEGEIGPGEDLDIVAQFIPEGLDEGVYELIALFEFDNLPTIEMSLVMSVNTPVADVTGVVVDPAQDDTPVESVRTEIDYYNIERFTDDEGSYIFSDLPMGNYVFTFTAPDFLPYTEDVNIGQAGEIELNVDLLHSECTPNIEDITFEIAPDADLQTSFEVSNEGNGPLTYNVERRLLGDANADPWTLRLSHMFGQDREDSRIQGVVFADDRFYVAGAHSNEPAIYIFSREGEYIDLFIQPGEDRYGMKDLAWDGRLIWGAIGQTIYGMTLDGDVEVEFEGPFRPTSNLAWDPEHELLWVSATTSDIAGIDRNGNLVSELGRQGLRMYGFGCWPDDPDDSPLYIFNRVRDVGDQVVHKMNVDNGELTLVSIFDPECGGGSAAGAFITNEYDIYSWVFIAVANDGADDRVDIWQIDARKEWMQLEPAEGVIEADNTQEFDLTLDATGLPPETFEGELVFLHDGVGSETHIPVTLRVVEGPVQAERTIQLEIGWNMVSVNLQPDPDDIRVLMRELVEADLLILMKDGLGRFYSPEFDFCNIPGWNVADGYQMKMDDAGEVTLAGITVMADDAIPLTDGWNLISYYPRTPVDAIVAFSGIVDQLLIAKDGWGRFYNPEWGFSNMGDLEELRGYQVKVTEDLELVYRLQAEDDEFVLNVCDRQGKLPVHPLTGSNMSLLVKDGSIPNGEIGVYVNNKLVGSGVLENGVCGIAVWGDDPTTSAIDGALEGESLELSLLDENGLHQVQFETLAGDDLYQTNGFWAVELLNITEIPDEFGIVSAYPNPFNSHTRVTYNLPEAAQVDMTLNDLSGRRIFDLVSGHKNAGQHPVVIDGSSLASGVYIVQLKVKDEVTRSKIALVK